ASPSPGWRDKPSPAMVRSQDAVVARLGVPVPLTLGFGTRAAKLKIWSISPLRSPLLRRAMSGAKCAVFLW
ncbi:MAG: hypothetical protein P8P79_16945, partial [Halioglobus sp.]|nr:hypothetical protein [Halioglobus sp.]